jgi:hypothetical protein
MMDDAIGRALPLPDGYKPSFKGGSGDTNKYNGSSKLIDLEEWLSTTTNRFALQRLGAIIQRLTKYER